MSDRKNSKGELQFQIVKAGVVFGLLLVSMALIHEAGHALICVSKNGSFSWNDFFMFAVRCSNNFPSDSLMLFWAMGGIFGMVGSLSFLIPKKLRKDKFILIGVFPNVAKNLVDCVFETFRHTEYLSNASLKIIIDVILPISLFLVLFIILTIHTKNKT